MEHKLITLDEMHLVESIIDKNPSWPSGKMMTPNQRAQLLGLYSSKLKEGTMQISVVLNDNEEAEAFYIGAIMPNVQAWVIHGPRVAKSSVVYSTSAKKCAPALDLLLEYMQQRMYFKFWQVDIGSRHLRRKIIMDNYSKFSSWYDTYDELHIPENFTTGITLYDGIGKGQIDDSDRIIRMFVLKQEHRIPYIDNYYENNK